MCRCKHGFLVNCVNCGSYNLSSTHFFNIPKASAASHAILTQLGCSNKSPEDFDIGSSGAKRDKKVTILLIVAILVMLCSVTAVRVVTASWIYRPLYSIWWYNNNENSMRIWQR